jgi:hypothetical protein
MRVTIDKGVMRNDQGVIIIQGWIVGVDYGSQVFEKFFLTETETYNYVDRLNRYGMDMFAEVERDFIRR